jgi:hypothetical protein
MGLEWVIEGHVIWAGWTVAGEVHFEGNETWVADGRLNGDDTGRDRIWGAWLSGRRTDMMRREGPFVLLLSWAHALCISYNGDSVMNACCINVF